jgi:hypothetical protein
MRIFLWIVSTLWLLFWLIFGYEMLTGTPKQMESDKLFIEKEINPAVNFVKRFKKENNRLPDSQEFDTWQRLNSTGHAEYITQKSQVDKTDWEGFENIKLTDDFFAIVVWRGEWNEYYFSDGDRYDTNNYDWKSSIFSCVFGLFIGLIPMGFWWWKFERKETTVW